MALKATIFKAEVQVSDMDRQYYGSHALRLARHPSETDERLMVRLLAFCLYAGEGLRFGKGLSTEDEADLHEIDATGRIEHWIDVGTPDPREVRKACGKADRVTVLAYGRTAETWWRQHREVLSGQPSLTVLLLPLAATEALAALASRTMEIQCMVQDATVWFTCGDTTIEICPQLQHPPPD